MSRPSEALHFAQVPKICCDQLGDGKAKFTPSLQTLIHLGGERLRGSAFIKAAKASDVLLTSYALVRRDGATFKQICRDA